MNTKAIFLLIAIAIATAKAGRSCSFDCPSESYPVCAFDYKSQCVYEFRNKCELKRINCEERGRFRNANPEWCRSSKPYGVCQNVSGY